jgi:hypothetical protein
MMSLYLQKVFRSLRHAMSAAMVRPFQQIHQTLQANPARA